MIHVIPTQITRFRAFGWIQDPSNLRSLCDVVAIFERHSAVHSNLLHRLLPELVEERDGQTRLIAALKVNPLRISYSNLVGTAFMPRKCSRCNGIVQAAVKGQTRAFICDWPADNFIRWAHAFAFIQYHYEDDTFELSENGRELVKARSDGGSINPAERELLVSAILAYPPAVRILNLLAKEEGSHLTKFELGRQLGFIGEDGFTSLPQALLIKSLACSTSTSEKNKMKCDWDGSSDKYARMIAKWLEKLGLVEQAPKSVSVSFGGKCYTESIAQAYLLSARGWSAINRTLGKSRHWRIPKNVCFEMMATKGPDREYLRTRRTYVLKAISESKGRISFEAIQLFLSDFKLSETLNTIKDDLQGLINIGLNIVMESDACILFVSGHFKGNVESQIERLCRNTLTSGKALNIFNLLKYADAIKYNALNHENCVDLMFKQ